jgi:amino acid transporter
MTAATYAEGTVLYPEAGGSSSFARYAFNEVISFGAAWAQMLVYIVTVATSAFFVPHYLSIFWGPLRENLWDIVGGVVVVVFLVLSSSPRRPRLSLWFGLLWNGDRMRVSVAFPKMPLDRSVVSFLPIDRICVYVNM